MTEKKNWEVRISSPNGTNGHFVFAHDSDDDALVEQFAAFLASMRDNDPEPDNLAEGTTAHFNPRREPAKRG